jgi:hypothetical protein
MILRVPCGAVRAALCCTAFWRTMGVTRQPTADWHQYLMLYGASSGPVPPFDPQRLNTAGSLFLTRPSLSHYTASREELLWRAGDVLGWAASGRLNIRIGGTYPLAEAARPTPTSQSRRTTGKLLPPPRCCCCPRAPSPGR